MCRGFQSPALLPLQGREVSRDRGWPALLTGCLPALPQPHRDAPPPHKTLNCHILPWPMTLHFNTSMKQPHPSAGRVPSLAGRGPPRPVQPPKVPDPTGAALTNPASGAKPLRHLQAQGLPSSRGSVCRQLCSRVKSNISTKRSSSKPEGSPPTFASFQHISSLI